MPRDAAVKKAGLSGGRTAYRNKVGRVSGEASSGEKTRQKNLPRREAVAVTRSTRDSLNSTLCCSLGGMRSPPTNDRDAFWRAARSRLTVPPSCPRDGTKRGIFGLLTFGRLFLGDAGGGAA